MTSNLRCQEVASGVINAIDGDRSLEIITVISKMMTISFAHFFCGV